MAGYRDLDGVDDFITLANESNFDFDRLTAHTVCAWVYVENAEGDAGSKTIVSKFENSANLPGWALQTRPGTGGRLVRVNLRNQTGNQIMRTTTDIMGLNTWECIGYTYSGSGAASGVKIYRQATEFVGYTTEDTLTGSMLHDTAVMVGVAAAGSFGNLRIAYLAIWDRELTSGEMTTFKNGGDVPQQDDLIAFLRMDAQQSPEPDEKGTNDGTLTGTTSSATGGPSVTYNTVASGPTAPYVSVSVA